MASAQDLATRLGEYYYLMEKNSAKLRTLPLSDVTDVYDAVGKEWHFPNPPRKDGEERRKYFEKCEEICNSTASTAKELMLIVFTSWAAIRVITDDEFLELSEVEWGSILGAANNYSMAKLGLSTTPSCSDLPPHVQDVLCPDRVMADSDADSDLIGQTIRYQDSVTGCVRVCSVEDIGTSKMKGKWYMITDKNSNDSEEPREHMITAKEMEDILAMRTFKFKS